jgi:indole-3-glycerol phosphate synthase
MTSVLETIVGRTRERVAERRLAHPIAEVLAAPGPPRRPFAEALVRPGVNVIAEFKRRSPSRGLLRADLTPDGTARAYETAGAAALSVLTEEDFFGGSLQDLRLARGATRSLPALRKDFVVDPYQIWEARAAGADAVLLIAAALDDRELRALLAEAHAARLEALVEVHDQGELDRALAAEARLVGVNNRNLKTLEVSLEIALSLAPLIPDEVVAVAESGIRQGADVRRLRDAGYDAFLVGEHLMAASDPGRALKSLIAEGQ